MNHRLRAMFVFSLLLLPLAGVARSQSTKPATQAAEDRFEAWRRSEEERRRNDWADLGRYRDANSKVAALAPGENRVVFMGDSITDGWINARPEFFKSGPYLDRGISGQTTPQMLIRFRPDVIDLKPKVVVILAGTNDIAGNTGTETIEQIEGNLQSMAQLARAAGIKVVLASILPVYDYPWKPGIFPADQIATINAWMKGYCEHNEFVYLDYYSAVVDERRGMKHELSNDGVHPTKAGYAIMEPLAVQAIAEALRKK